MKFITKLFNLINSYTTKPPQDAPILYDKEPLVLDCVFCRNAYTCDDLSIHNDLSYMSCGSYENNVRLLFRSGDNRATKLIVEQHGDRGWELIAYLTPTFCPFCGRVLFENYCTKENRNV